MYDCRELVDVNLEANDLQEVYKAFTLPNLRQMNLKGNDLSAVEQSAIVTFPPGEGV